MNNNVYEKINNGDVKFNCRSHISGDKICFLTEQGYQYYDFITSKISKYGDEYKNKKLIHSNDLTKKLHTRIKSGDRNNFILHGQEDEQVIAYLFSNNGKLLYKAPICDRDTYTIKGFNTCEKYSLLESQPEDCTLMLWNHELNKMIPIYTSDYLGMVTKLENNKFFVEDDDGLNILSIDPDNIENYSFENIFAKYFEKRKNKIYYWLQEGYAIVLFDGIIYKYEPQKDTMTKISKENSIKIVPLMYYDNNCDMYCNNNKLVYRRSSYNGYKTVVHDFIDGTEKPFEECISSKQVPTNFEDFKFIDDNHCILTLEKNKYRLIDVNLYYEKSKL